MKVPISNHAVIDLEAPVLPAYEQVVEGVTKSHGAAEGQPLLEIWIYFGV